MRTLALLAALLLSVGGLAGCVGEEEDPVGTNNVDVGGNAGANANTGAPNLIQVLAALDTTISTDASAWMAPGSTMTLEASAPAKADANLTYTWAIGIHPYTTTIAGVELDTGIIEPGASKTLTYDAAGTFLMHCHPHPFMKHNVTVIEGYEGAATATVQIIDGDTPETFRFVPENIVIAPGTTVTYVNAGTQPHTATLEMAGPSLKALPVTGPSPEITLEGDGWMRVVAIVQDDEGRFGSAEHAVYVKDIPANFEGSYTGAFDAAATPPATTPADDTLQPEDTHALELELGGRAFLNVTIVDPSGEGANQIAIHLVQEGATQDSLTVNPGETAAMGTINGGPYNLVVQGAQGVSIEYTVTLQVVYDLVPPKLEAPDAGGEHGGHGGHDH